MAVENLSEVLLITRQTGLRRLAERLADEAVVAVDTESNSLHAYREKVCLVQFSTLQEDFLVDPLALKRSLAAGADLRKSTHRKSLSRR